VLYRHPEYHVPKQQTINLDRKQAHQPENIRIWFDKYKTVCEARDIHQAMCTILMREDFVLVLAVSNGLTPENLAGRVSLAHQQKKRVLQTDRAGVRTACIRPIRSVRPKRPPLRPVRPERPERPGVLGLHLLRLVPPNTLVPVLTTRRTCHGLIPSEHPPSVSSRPAVSGVDLADSGSPTA